MARKGKGRPSAFMFELRDSSAGPTPPRRPPPPQRHAPPPAAHSSPPPDPPRLDHGSFCQRIDLGSVCALVPHLPPRAVRAHCARELEAGRSVDAVVDHLLSLRLDDDSLPSPLPSLPLPSPPLPSPPLPPLPRPEAPWLARLPDEIAALLLEQLPLADVGRLGKASGACRAFTARWLAALPACRVGRPTRGWRDERVLALLRATSGARALHVAGKDVPHFRAFARLAELPVCARLEELRLSHCAHLQPHHLPLLCSRCPRLTTLEISACPALSDASLIVLGRLPKLRHLTLSRMAQLAAPSLQKLVRRCVSLDSADFSYSGEGFISECSPATGGARRGARGRRPPQGQRPASVAPQARGASPTPEESYALAAVDVEEWGEDDDDDEVDAWEGSQRCGWEPLNVARLWVRGWSSLSHLELMAADRLENLNVGDCKQLLSLRLDAPRLTRLTAHTCVLLVTIELRCPSLTHLLLCQCKRLQLLQLACAVPLEHVNLHSCRELGAPALSALLQSSGSAVRTLDLTGAIGTEEASEELLWKWCPSLRQLDASGRARKY
ncbi:hypothetical protein AB1Y20_020709 [Prymnesium parvum]|uniref:F-box domain-containing protein n=1 Tax=Prymnesium parvum TaxID=97485 RepID=A0AB34JY88_PRYPA